MKRKLLFAAMLIAGALGGNLYAQFDADKVYTIANNNDNQPLMQDNGTGVVALGSQNDNSYWKFVATGNADCYYIQNATTGKFIQGYSTSEQEVATGDNGVEYYVKADADGNLSGKYRMSCTSNSPHDFSDGTLGLNWKSNNTVQSFASVAGGNPRSAWIVTEATLPEAPVSLSSPYSGSVLAEGDFFLYNVETGLWLQNNEKNTGDWNTRGATGTYGFEFGISAITGGYKLDPKFGHNHSMNASNFYLDTNDDVTAWTIEAKEVNGMTNAYTIKSGDQVLGLDDNNNLALGTSQKSVWQLVTRAERIAYLTANATADAPVDATFLIQDPSFANENERAGSWQWNRNGGNLDDVRWYRNRRSYAVWNTSNFTLTQTINNVPDGKYKLTIKGYYRDGNRDDVTTRRAAGEEKFLANYFINESKEKVMSILDGAQSEWSDGKFYYPAADANAPYGHYPDNADAFNRIFQDNPDVYTNTGVIGIVSGGSMIIGIEKIEANASDWFAFDDFRLVYLGNEIDLSEFIAALDEAIKNAEEFDASNTSDFAKSALATALATAKEKRTSTNSDEIAAATTDLTNALTVAKGVNVAMLKQTIAFAEAEGINITAANAVVANATTATEVDAALAALRTARKMNALGGAADIYTGSVPAAGEFYFFNLGTGMWLNQGSDWCTHAAVDQAGLLVTFEESGEGFIFRTPWGTFNNSPYTDTGGNTVYTFQAVEGKTNVFNILEGSDLMGWNPDGKTDGKKYWSSISNVTGADPADPNYQWKIVSKAERDALLATATATAPVDATYLLNNPSLMRQPGYNMWNKVADGGNGGARVSSQDDGNGDRAADFGWEYYDTNSFTFSQQLEGLAPGLYTVSAQGFYRDGDGGYQAGVVNNDGELLQLAYLFANNEKALLPNIATEAGKVPGIASMDSKNGAIPNWPREAFEFFETGFYKATVNVVVGTDGKLNIGIGKDSKTTNGDWVVLDNFRLTYLGPVAESIDVTITDAKYATFVAPFEAEMPAGVTANTATVSGETIVLTPVEGKVAAHTPVILSAEAAKEFQVSGYPTVAPAELKNGALTGTYTEIEAPEGSYVLQSQNGKVGFYLVDQAVATPKVGANRAYLTAPSGDGNVKAYLLGDLETAIKALETADMKDAVIFNLAGQRVGKAVKGIYIVNGKKAVVK